MAFEKRNIVHKAAAIVKKSRMAQWLFIFMLTVATAAGAIYIVNPSFATEPTAIPHRAEPTTGQVMYLNATEQSKTVQFVTNYSGTANDGVSMQVAYRLKSETTWTIFGTKSTIVNQTKGSVLKPNSITSTLSDDNGLNCTMGWGSKTPPKTCDTVWTNGVGKSGKSAWKNTNIYFPTVQLSPGDYVWTTRTFIRSTSKYSDWQDFKTSGFSVKTYADAVKDRLDNATKEKVQAAAAEKAATLKAAAEAAQKKLNSLKTITIETFGYNFSKKPHPPKEVNKKFVARVTNIIAGDFTKKQTGLDADVVKRVMAVPAAQKWLTTMETKWEPQFSKIKGNITVGIGCARGHQRSVVLSRQFGKWLHDTKGYTVKYVDRDLTDMNYPGK